MSGINIPQQTNTPTLWMYIYMCVCIYIYIYMCVDHQLCQPSLWTITSAVSATTVDHHVSCVSHHCGPSAVSATTVDHQLCQPRLWTITSAVSATTVGGVCVSITVKRLSLLSCAVDWWSTNCFYYYYYMLVGHSCIAYSFLAKGDIHTFLDHALLFSQHI